MERLHQSDAEQGFTEAGLGYGKEPNIQLRKTQAGPESSVMPPQFQTRIESQYGVNWHMGILNQLLNRKSNQLGCSDPNELRAIWDSYSNEWPDNNDRYGFWKPASVLPAPKWAIKRATKLCYAEWPEPINWTVYSGFFMEFADLALHLPQEEYDAIENFRRRPIKSRGTEDKNDPLLRFRPLATAACSYTTERSNEMIIRIRDGLRRSAAWDPVGADDCELDVVRRILLESATEFATLIEEWRFYILSIGRDHFINKS